VDEDVLAEQNAAKDIYERRRADSAETALVVADLTKNFGAFPAVRGLSFTVRKGNKMQRDFPKREISGNLVCFSR
jgi:hypothetical protein